MLAWNTLEEAAAILSDETKKDWTARKVIHECDANGIFLHTQLQITPEICDAFPAWVAGSREMVELPFNLDVQSFLGGEGLIRVIRFNGVPKQFKPAFNIKLEQLRISKAALCELLEVFKSKNAESKQSNSQETANNGQPDYSEQSEQEICDLFDPMNRKAIAALFDKIREVDWTRHFSRARRNGLSDARQGEGKAFMYNPWKVGEWLINKGTYTREQIDRKLANNLPERSKDKKYLIIGDFD